MYKDSVKADDGQYYFKLGTGHCTGSSRMKTKSTTDKACNNFKLLQRRTSNE